MKWFFIGIGLFAFLVLNDVSGFKALLVTWGVVGFFAFILRDKKEPLQAATPPSPQWLPDADMPPPNSAKVSEDELRNIMRRLTRLEQEVVVLREKLGIPLPPSPAETPSTPQQIPQAPVVAPPPPIQVPPAALPDVSFPPIAATEAATASVRAASQAAAHTVANVPFPPIGAPQSASATSATSPRPVSAPVPPSSPTLFDKAKAWLIGGNPLVRIGILILFFGVSFLLKLAAEYGMFPIEFRLAAVAAGALALLVIGWRLREKRRDYALILQGGSIGVLYLVIFAAFKFYVLLPSLFAFALMVVVCALSAFLAIRQDARSFAFMAAAGGFLAPILISTGGGSHVALFSYYALLNAGILGIAWFKAWRSLNLLGFLFTFGIGTLWGWQAYTPAHFASTEPFLILFFVFYVAVGLLYALRREIALKSTIDGTLIFGTPLAFCGLQAAMLYDNDWAMAWTAVALSAFYLAISAWLTRYRRERLQLLFESMLAMGVLFATLAIPLAFDGRLTSAVWAVEGAAILWAALRQRRRLALVSSLALQLFSAIAFGSTFDQEVSYRPVLNSGYIGMVMLALAGLFSGWQLQRAPAREWLRGGSPELSVTVGLWGLAWWIGAGVIEIHRHVSPLPDAVPHFLLFALLTAWLAHAAQRLLAWRHADWVALTLVPIMALLVLPHIGTVAPLTGLGLLAWPLTVILAYVLLFRQQKSVEDVILGPLHTLLFWTLASLFALQWHAFVARHVPEGTWAWCSWGLAGALLLFALVSLSSRIPWPLQRYRSSYIAGGAAPLAILLCAWSILSLFSAGDASPLPYLPLLNPLELCQLLVLAALFLWRRALERKITDGWRGGLEYAVYAMAFLWLNSVLLRSLHVFTGIDYHVESVLDSINVQLAFVVLSVAYGWGGLTLLRVPPRSLRFVNVLLPVVLVLWGWTFYANFSYAGSEWGRLPLLNPLDLTLLAVFALLIFYTQRTRRLVETLMSTPLLISAFGVSAFVWLNAMLLRAMHHWLSIPYRFDLLFASTLVQTALSILWTLLALALMVVAVRRAIRPLWFVGISLLAITVGKLFLIELANIGGLERIFSFIGVGVLLLLIGYLAPLPPKRKESLE